MDRTSMGQEKVGIPQMEAVEALLTAVDGKGWSDFERPVVGYYLERMIGNHLLSLIDSGLDDDALRNLDSNEVRSINLILLRDHFRHNADVLRKEQDTSWIDNLFDLIFSKFQIPQEKHKQFREKFELDDIDNIGWAEELAKPFGFMPEKLFVCHSSIVTGVKEDLLKKKKPWWKFW